MTSVTLGMCSGKEKRLLFGSRLVLANELADDVQVSGRPLPGRHHAQFRFTPRMLSHRAEHSSRIEGSGEKVDGWTDR